MHLIFPNGLWAPFPFWELPSEPLQLRRWPAPRWRTFSFSLGYSCYLPLWQTGVVPFWEGGCWSPGAGSGSHQVARQPHVGEHAVQIRGAGSPGFLQVLGVTFGYGCVGTSHQGNVMSVEKPSGHPTAHFILTLPVPHTGTQVASTSISGPSCQLPRLQSASKFS